MFADFFNKHFSTLVQIGSKMGLSVYLTYIVILLCPMPACALETDATKYDGMTRHDITVETTPRTYYYHLPKAYSGTKTPVVFFFHGGGGEAISFARNIHLCERADDNSFIAVAPEGYDNHWEYGVPHPGKTYVNDLAFVNKMMEQLQKEFNVDQDRIYFAGFSDGGWFTQWLTYHIPNKMAAAAAVCALEPVDWLSKYGDSHPRLPILFMFGTEDPRMHWSGGITPNKTKVISANATVQSWLLANRCSQKAETVAFPNKCHSDGSRVDASFYRGRDLENPAVAFYRIIGGGHAWPGGARTSSANGNVNEDIDATQEIWNFFKRHKK
jgi:polyhydroxybutyrate depolymerase